MSDPKVFRQAVDALAGAPRIRCICHYNPDGDALGSMIGIALLLGRHFPDKVVDLHCVDPAPPPFHFLPAVHRIRCDLEVREGDAFVVLDSAEPKLTGFDARVPQVFDKSFTTVNIDHHPSNTRFGSHNLVFPETSSTCEILVHLADALGWPVDAETATALLTGIYTDTGGLLHSNTTSDVYRTVARLLRAGAKQQTIVKNVFRTAKLSTLRLWGRVLEKISLSEEGVAISAVTEGDFRATGADHSELTGAIDYVNAIPGMKFSMILSERGGKVKGSLRTLRDDVDVSDIAAKFKGGGHKRAAGFALPGKLTSEVRWKVTESPA